MLSSLLAGKEFRSSCTSKCGPCYPAVLAPRKRSCSKRTLTDGLDPCRPGSCMLMLVNWRLPRQRLQKRQQKLRHCRSKWSQKLQKQLVRRQQLSSSNFSWLEQTLHGAYSRTYVSQHLHARHSNPPCERTFTSWSTCRHSRALC